MGQDDNIEVFGLSPLDLSYPSKSSAVRAIVIFLEHL